LHPNLLALPGASGVHKRRQAAQDTHPFKKFFFPVDPRNAAEVSLFMSLYTEHKAPKNLKAFQGMAAHWNTMKWVQRDNSAWLGIAYKDGVQLRNFHRKLSAEVGCIESLKLAGLLQAPPPPPLPPIDHQIADGSLVHMSVPAQTAGLLVEPAAHSSAVHGQTGALHGSEPQAVALSHVPTLAPSPAPSPVKKKPRSAAGSTQGTLLGLVARPAAVAGSGPSTSAPSGSSGAAATGKHCCNDCWVHDWWAACVGAPRFGGPGRIDPWSIQKIPTTRTNHKKMCTNKGLFDSIFSRKERLVGYEQLIDGRWSLFNEAKKKKPDYKKWMEATSSGWNRR